jgi:hypothetical protein
MVIVPSSLLSDPESAPELLPQLLRAKVLKEIAAAATKVFFTTVFPPHQRGCSSPCDRCHCGTSVSANILLVKPSGEILSDKM